MPNALKGFLTEECTDAIASDLRAKIGAPGGIHRRLNTNLFEFEVVYGEDRVRITDVASLGYEPVDLTIQEFLSALPDVTPATTSRPVQPQRVIIPPPPE